MNPPESDDHENERDDRIWLDATPEALALLRLLEEAELIIQNQEGP